MRSFLFRTVLTALVAGLMFAPPPVRATAIPITPPYMFAVFKSADDVPLTRSFVDLSFPQGVALNLAFAPPAGTNLTVVNSTGLNFISGRFINVAQGQKVNLVYNGTTYHFVANYYGGTGNDLVLQWAGTTLMAWGSNGNGELGNHQAGGHKSNPQPVPASGALAGKTVLSMATGSAFSLALCSDGTIAGWGSNLFGALGIRNNSSKFVAEPTPVDKTGVLADKTVIALSAGLGHTLALCSDGTVAAWGYGYPGQLGDNGSVNRAVPVAVSTSGVLLGKTVIAISAGDDHSLALGSDGSVFAWGYNHDGELGNGDTLNAAVPVKVDTTGVLLNKTVIAIAAGGSHNLALCSDGTLAAWGANNEGQLGTGNIVPSTVPVAVNVSGALSGKTVVKIAAGGSNSMALCSDGTLAVWGYDGYIYLGNAILPPRPARSLPVIVSGTGALAGKTVTSIAAGSVHCLARCSDGTLAAFGGNMDGQVGSGSEAVSILEPAAVHTSSNSPFLQVASGSMAEHSLALVAAQPFPQMLVTQADGTRLISGSTVDFGSLVPGATITKTFTVKNTGTATLISHFSSLFNYDMAETGFNFVTLPPGVLAPDEEGTFVVSFTPVNFGTRTVQMVIDSNDAVTLGFHVTLTGSRSNSLPAAFNTATDVPLTSSSVSATGATVTLAINFAPSVGTSLTVVNNTGLDFIHGTFGNLAQGQPVDLAYDGTTYHFVANYYGGTGNDLVLQWAGAQAVAWGWNDHGQLGNNTVVNTITSAPALVASSGVLSGRTVTAVAAGETFSLALCSDGSIAAWGNNNHGQLGNNSTADSALPVQVDATGVLAGKTVIAIAAGYEHSLALCTDGSLAAWGLNVNGALGNNSSVNSSVPVLVDMTGAFNGRKVVTISAGLFHSLALCSDGRVAAWGDNFSGELGNNSKTQSHVPVLVDTSGELYGKTVIAIAAGPQANMALCSDGTLVTWGSNGYGEAGNNSTTGSLVPVPVDATGVLAGRKPVAISVGFDHRLVLCADGTLVAWGGNIHGQLGDGTKTSQLLPVQAGTTGALAGRSIVSMSAGVWTSLALCSDGTLAAWGAQGPAGLQSIAQVSTELLPDGARFVTATIGSNARHNMGIIALPKTNATAPRLSVQTAPRSSLANGGVVNFGNLSLGGKATKTIILKNIGTAPLAVSEVTLNGGSGSQNFTLGEASAGYLGAGASLTFTVTFTAENEAAHAETLQFATNDPKAASFTIKLKGTGVTPRLLVANYTSPQQVPVTARGYTATGKFITGSLQFAPATGTTLTIINNTGPGFIQGTFGNLKQGQAVNLTYAGTAYHFVANYYGGTGNDLVLQWADTTLFAWGYNGAGGLGNHEDGNNRLAPVKTDASGLLKGRTILAVAAGGGHSLALCADGTLAAWGANGAGQLGNGSPIEEIAPAPVRVNQNGALKGKTVVAISAGSAHNLALCSDGTLAAWGSNFTGQLGNNSTEDSSVPVLVDRTGVLKDRTVVAISAGYTFNLALCSDGTLAAWGDNELAQLGNGTITFSLVPQGVDQTGVLAGKTITAISAGGYNSLALCSDGTVAEWGYAGALFDAAIHHVPVTVDTSTALAGRQVVAIAASTLSNSALCADGTVAIWGHDDLLPASDSSPTVFGGTGAIATKTAAGISGGSYFTLIRYTDGSLSAWGANDHGELGNNSTVDSPTPVLVDTTAMPAGSRIVQATSGPGSFHSLALVANPPFRVAPAFRRYSGLVTPASNALPGISARGSFTATVQSNGTFTAQYMPDGRTFRFAGTLAQDNTARFGSAKATRFILAAEKSTQPELALELNRNADGSLSGTVTQTSRSEITAISRISADLIVFDGLSFETTVPSTYLSTNNAPGIYNVLFPASASIPGLTSADYPQGTGFARLSITRKGSGGLAARLADGTSFTAASTLISHPGDSPTLSIPLFAQLYNRRGYVSISMTFKDGVMVDNSGDIPNGSVWVRPTLGTQAYPRGWPDAITTPAFAARHTITPGQSLLGGLAVASDSGNAALSFEKGLLTTGITRSLNITPADSVTKIPTTDRSFSLAINHTTGLFSGVFLHTDGTRPAFQGIIVQTGIPGAPAPGGYGFFLSVPSKAKSITSQSGEVNLFAQ